MRKLASVRVSYRDDFFISYCVYIVTGSFHISLFKGTLDKIREIQNETLRMRYPFQSTGRPISHRNAWSFRVCMTSLRDFVPKWNSRPGTKAGVNWRRGDSREIALKYALKLIFLKCLFEFMINTAPPASNSVYGSEKLFWYVKKIFFCSGQGVACTCK